jgi:hypothetical protein
MAARTKEEIAMRSNSRVACSVLCSVVFAAFLAGCDHDNHPKYPPILRGVDVFETSAGTTVDFSGHPIPAGFFGPGCGEFKGSIALTGKQLATQPPLPGGPDTVVERLKDGNFDEGKAEIPVKARALQLTSTAPISVTCGGNPTPWQTDVCLCDDEQPKTEIKVTVDPACGCGTFSGSLKLKTCIRFTDSAGKVAGPIKQEVDLQIKDMPWCPKPGLGQSASPPFKVNTSCAGKPDLDQMPGSSNFFPGWTCGTQSNGKTCLQQHADLTKCHPANPADPNGHQHCFNPVCDREKN